MYRTIYSEETASRVLALLSHPARCKYTNIIAERFGDRPLYLVGGAVRDSWLRRGDPPSDLDYLVDDSAGELDLHARMQGLRNVRPNRKGNPKWLPSDSISIDISSLSSNNRSRNGESVPLTIKGKLSSCDLTTSAIAIDLKSGELHSYGALEAYENRQLDILYELSDHKHVIVAKLLLHSMKLGYNLGPKSAQMLRSDICDRTLKDALHFISTRHPNRYKNACQQFQRLRLFSTTNPNSQGFARD